jgi:hypothetical protein
MLTRSQGRHKVCDQVNRPPRRLTQLLAFAALIAGVLPATAAGAEGGTASHDPHIAAATWSLVATLDPAHVQASRSVLTLYGVYAFTPILVNFNPKVVGPSINQSAVPLYAVPADGRSHPYKVVFHLTTDVTTTTGYGLNDRPPVTVAGGDSDLEFTETIQGPAPGSPGIWRSWALRNSNNDHWLFYSAKIHEQTS